MKYQKRGDLFWINYHGLSSQITIPLKKLFWIIVSESPIKKSGQQRCLLVTAGCYIKKSFGALRESNSTLKSVAVERKTHAQSMLAKSAGAEQRETEQNTPTSITQSS